MEWKYRTTNDYIQFISFHDCVAGDIRLEKDTVVFYLEHVDITENHPLNPFKVAKSTDRGRLEFSGVRMNEAIIYCEDGRDKEVVITDLLELEILQFNQTFNGTNYIFEISGIHWDEGQFCSVKVEAEKFILEWNDYMDDAWFAGLGSK